MIDQQVENENTIRYVDLNEFKYSDNTIRFLRSKLDDFAISCFRSVAKATREGTGLTKTSITNYTEQRKKYDAAFLLLEGQGFIEVKADGVKKPYFLSVRGYQLVAYLQGTKANRESATLD